MTARRKKNDTSTPESQRDAVLMAALPDVAFDGWTDELLTRAAAKAGIADTARAELFPDGVASLLVHFSNWADRSCAARLADVDLPALRVRERIALGVRTRLEVLEPYKAAVSAALGHSINPHNARRLPRSLWRTADQLWWLAGDTATDWNHYSKRTLLSGVLASTTLYWLSDASDDHADTWAFLDRRIDNVLTLGKSIGKIKDWASAIKRPFHARRRAHHPHSGAPHE